MRIIDAHEDLAWNILTFGRDYTLPVNEIRKREQGREWLSVNGDSLLGYPEYQRGKLELVFATLFASPSRLKKHVWDTQCYANSQEAHQLYRVQLDVYHRICDQHPQAFRLVESQTQLDKLLDQWRWNENQQHPVGLVILMEGAEGVRAVRELEEWWEQGVRWIGPAWAGTRFCGGTKEPGPLTKDGFSLLDGMADLGFGLDISHMDEAAALQSLDFYPGVIAATHANVQSLLKGVESNRHLSDRVIRGLLERDGVIGVVPYNAFLKPGWKFGDPRLGITLRDLVSHIDYICQFAGDACHVGIGSDFDGGFGLQSVPEDVDSIADLAKLGILLDEKGYSSEDTAMIMGGNWLRLLKQVLPG